MHPISYAKGISEIGNIIKKTKIIPDFINVGGGFPTCILIWFHNL